MNEATTTLTRAGCAAGISRPKYPGTFARCRGGATKHRSGAPDENYVRERAEHMYAAATRTADVFARAGGIVA